MGGEENSWGQGQAWLPLWKSPPHPPLHRGAEADSPLPAQMYACCPFSRLGCGRQKLDVGTLKSRWTLVRTNLSCSGHAPHWAIDVKESDLHRTNPFTLGLTLGK